VDRAIARPVVKWAGGKRSLVDQLRHRMPARFETYAEPFCGGAAVFFALASEPDRRFKKAILSDKNEDLIACYRAIKNQVGALIKRLKDYEVKHLALGEVARKDHYYEVRAAKVDAKDDVARGARLIFLNRTCFNGLWRVNASGVFNVPFGRYAKPRILDEDAIRAAQKALSVAELRTDDFADVARWLSSRDFVYFDPPYVPVSRTANFTAYSERFGPKEQDRLVDVLRELKRRRVRALLSNTYSEVTRKLYQGFTQERVTMRRAINSDVNKRGEVDELLVMTYTPSVKRKAS
jgi:DNA adenine methylase